MRFCEQLNAYIEQLGCTARELSEAAGISAATLSRYRSGERVPERDSAGYERLCAAIAARGGWDPAEVAAVFGRCSDLGAANRAQLRENFDTLMTVLRLNPTQLARGTNYDPSAVIRIRNGTRQPAEPEKFAADVARCAARQAETAGQQATLAQLLGCPAGELTREADRTEAIRRWLLEGRSQAAHVGGFLEKLDEFDLNEYIRAIHFDELKVPALPFQLPTSRSYTGLQQMMDSELDFLKATVLHRSAAPVIMYSDMPLEEMAGDPEFPKKWMLGMALMLKKGLQLHQIHNLNRPFGEMLLGLESWIPMYMTGQISPYYLKTAQNGPFLHLLKVSGAAALSGEAIAGSQGEGRYYLTKSRDEVAYYTRRAHTLLQKARPLMEIYRAGRAEALDAFLQEDAGQPGSRRNIRFAPPLYAMDEPFLAELLARRQVPEPERTRILVHAARQRSRAEEILTHGTITDEVPVFSPAEFAPVPLPLAGAFCEDNLFYTYDEYAAHWQQAEAYARAHPGYSLRRSLRPAFSNLEICMHEGRWAMVSKGRAPAIHFVIHHPRLRSAIEHFTPPMVD